MRCQQVLRRFFFGVSSFRFVFGGYFLYGFSFCWGAVGFSLSASWVIFSMAFLACGIFGLEVTA